LGAPHEAGLGTPSERAPMGNPRGASLRAIVLERRHRPGRPMGGGTPAVVPGTEAAQELAYVSDQVLVDLGGIDPHQPLSLSGEGSLHLLGPSRCATGRLGSRRAARATAGRRWGPTCRPPARLAARLPSTSATPPPPTHRPPTGRPPAASTGAGSAPAPTAVPTIAGPCAAPPDGQMLVARTVQPASCRPLASTATRAWVRLWPSLPRGTMDPSPLNRDSGPVGGHA